VTRGPWRLLRDDPAPAAWNLAVDEALLLAAGRDGPPPAPVLRLYGWAPAALSLGRLQSAAAAPDAAWLAARGFDLVRRPTGGAAVLHDRERTYAVVARLRAEPFPGGVLDTYACIARALVRGLTRLGLDAVAVAPPRTARGGRAAPPLCFAATSHHEIAVGGVKVIGSAQLRRRGAFLQHGSIVLRADPLGGARAGLEDLLDRTLAPDEIDAAIVGGFEAECAATLVPGALTPDESEAAGRLAALTYRAAAWTLNGRR
jgi:lipoate-protein ligase A